MCQGRMDGAAPAVWGNQLEKKHVVLSNQAILLQPQQGLFYKNEHIFSFAKYTIGLQAEFEAITKYQNQVP